MCGIVGYVGPRDAVPILLAGLRRLEYRGYDSAGLALHDDEGGISAVKRPGKIAELEGALAAGDLSSHCGIGHTRWATHGPPNQVNAHPHQSGDGEIALIHNGIIENAGSIRRRLEEKGYVFISDTDTESVVHLIDEAMTPGVSLEDAVAAALAQVDGTYGIAVVSSRDPGKLVCARQGSPLLLGIGEEGEYFVAPNAAL